MKKFGFTLAEILIALGIVGVVGAMTIPQLSLETKKQTNEAKRDVCVSDLENAFTMMMAQENAITINETPIWSDGANVIDTMNLYTKVTSSGDQFAGDDCSAADSEYCFTTKKGAHVKLNKSTYKIDIDVNGASSPNSNGVDQFSYNLTQDGLLEPQE